MRVEVEQRASHLEGDLPELVFGEMAFLVFLAFEESVEVAALCVLHQNEEVVVFNEAPEIANYVMMTHGLQHFDLA